MFRIHSVYTLGARLFFYLFVSRKEITRRSRGYDAERKNKFWLHEYWSLLPCYAVGWETTLFLGQSKPSIHLKNQSALATRGHKLRPNGPLEPGYCVLPRRKTLSLDVCLDVVADNIEILGETCFSTIQTPVNIPALQFRKLNNLPKVCGVAVHRQRNINGNT